MLVPDLAGWRRERMPEMPTGAYVTLAPDVWFVDPIAKTLEILRLVEATYAIHATFHGDIKVHATPFEAIGLDLSILWAR